MNISSLIGKRVLITQADTFMGPTLCEVFTELGAVVIADNRPLLDPDLPAELVSSREDAQFAAFLYSDAAACFVGQAFPVCGGRVAR